MGSLLRRLLRVLGITIGTKRECTYQALLYSTGGMRWATVCCEGHQGRKIAIASQIMRLG